MKKKALLLMLFFMFISTNAVAQVSCGAVEPAVDQQCLDFLLPLCEEEYLFYLGSCAPTREMCDRFCVDAYDSCNDDFCNDDCEDVSDLCTVTTGDWMTCSYEFFRCTDKCDYQERTCGSTKNTCMLVCVNQEGNCRYVALEKRFACKRAANAECTIE
jgi:hypothetical protein